MAALTVSGRESLSLGNLKGEIGQVTLAATGDTVVTGLGTILWVGITCTTATAGQYVQASISGSTITLVAEGGTPVINYFAVGTA